MSNKVLTTRGREVMAEVLSALPFVAALSAGDSAWDVQWSETNPPAPDLGATGVLSLIGYVRPTIVDFVEPDPEGAIVTEEGGAYAIATGRTRYLRIRVSVPAGAFPDVYVREIGIFTNPEFSDGLPAGKTVLEPGDVVAPGDLMHILWSPPQFLNAGTAYSRNFILKV
ncbi:hypothetical protein [Devosia naphthalenivorans]|uniref:hypothetical protein n=1 Tax=Devosia naphthalenivorans TaxID=2082392 RepID=UPI000D3A8CD4|nr:hypothetical protein [Devosia naphthalenivorans]